MIEISVIIPHFNDPAGLERCLAALERQTLPRERFEIVVADNGSVMPFVELQRIVGGRATLVSQLQPGAGPARNAAVAASRGRILAFTDSDCAADPAWLEAGLAALMLAPLAGGRVSVQVRDPAAKSSTESFEAVFAFDNKRYVEKLHFSVTANLFCSRDVFDAVGVFQAGVSEDYDWCQRARKAGFVIGYAPDAIVFHPARENWAQLIAKWRRLQSEAFALHSPRFANKVRWLARAWLLPLSIVAHTPKILLSTALSSPRDRLGAFACLARLRLWRMIDAHRLAFGLPR